MKNLFYFFLMALVLFLSCDKEKFQKCCSCIEKQGNSDKYVFPIRPGMEEWKKLESHQAMVKICQIPSDVLQNMCTFGLVDTYYDYPLLFTIFAFNNINMGLSQVADEFNGFGELLTRTDCATKLLEEYEVVNPSDLDTTWTALEQGGFTERIRTMEVTLSFNPVLEKFTSAERKKAIQMGIEKLKKKEDNGYSGPSLIVNIYLIGNLLKQEGYVPFLEFINYRDDMKLFLSGNLNYLSYVSDGDKIENYAISFLNQQKK